MRSGGWVRGELEKKTNFIKTLCETLREVIKRKKCRTNLGSHCVIVSTKTMNRVGDGC